jgi:molybdopterin/thiamine biosynthesis adenylyltransferase
MYLTRHSDMISGIDMSTPILVIGAGSIGSYSVLALTKLGFDNITVVDDGIVEEENIAPQFFGVKQLKKKKVEALARNIKEQTNIVIKTLFCKYEPVTVDAILTSVKPTVIISALDSMSGRAFIAKKLVNDTLSEIHTLIDARMSISFLTLFTYDPYIKEQYEWYASTLFSDENAVQEACTNKAISYTSLIAGALVAKTALNRIKNKLSTSEKQSIVNYDIENFDMLVIKTKGEH